MKGIANFNIFLGGCMNTDRNLTPYAKQRGRFPSLFTSNWLPNIWNWDEMEENMNQWFGKNTGVSVSEDNQNVYVEANVPGLKPEEIEVTLDHNTLRIRGEKKEEEEKGKTYYRRAQQSFFYQVDLPSQVQENTEQAEYQEGILKISFKKAKKDAVKKINVKSAQKKEKK